MSRVRDLPKASAVSSGDYLLIDLNRCCFIVDIHKVINTVWGFHLYNITL